MAHGKFSGIYPMQFAFFDGAGRLDRGAMRRQVRACTSAGAHGIACLGLGTEVGKLSLEERHRVIDWVTAEVAGRVPVAVTVAGDNVAAQVALGRYAKAAGASWLILQPPPMRDLPESHCVQFFEQVMAGIDLPCAIQNAPEYLGVGLAPAAIAELAQRAENFVLLKGEGPALSIRRAIEAVGSRVAVFNGRGGLELIDNLRAGCAGIIPATDTFDYQVRVFEAMHAGDAKSAEDIYQRVLPAIVFIMQSLDQFLCYGKRIAAWRLGLGEVFDRQPALAADAFGLECARRYADTLGPLP